jgi:hypothetical protein
MEAAWPSETFLCSFNTTQCHNTEDLNLNPHHHENLKSCFSLKQWVTFCLSVLYEKPITVTAHAKVHMVLDC